MTLLGFWFMLDGNIGLIVICLPSLRPYLHLIRDKSYNSQSRMSKHGVTGGAKAMHATAPTSKFDRIEDVPEDGRIYVCTKVTQSARPVSASVARDGLPW